MTENSADVQKQADLDGEVVTGTSSVGKLAQGAARAFTSLRQRNFRLFWSGQIVSVLGSWMQGIGQAWLVLELTHSVWQLSLVGALQALPILLFSLFGGVFADRWPKRRVLLVTKSAAMLQALLLWVLIYTGAVQVWHIYALALLLGLTNSLDFPTNRAFVVEMVGRGDLPNAIALNSSITTLARIIGPSFGGIVIATSGVTMLFLLNAVSFLAVIIALMLMRSSELHAQARPATEKRQSTWQSLNEGWSYVRSTPVVLLLIMVVGLALLFGSNFNVILPLFATSVLNEGATGYGFLSAAFGVGAFLSTFWLAWGNQKTSVRRMLIIMFIFGGLEVAFAGSRIYFLSLALITCTGFVETAFASQSMATLQALPPDHLRGRVMSIQVLLFDGSLPLGYVLTGWLAGLYGAPIALLDCALLVLVVTLMGWVWHRSLEIRKR